MTNRHTTKSESMNLLAELRASMYAYGQARIDGNPAKIAEARALVEVLFERNTGEKLNWAVLEVER